MELVRSIRAPTLPIGADEDIVRPEHYLKIHRNLAQAQLFSVPGTIHGTLLRNPLFNTEVSRFLDEAFSRPRR